MASNFFKDLFKKKENRVLGLDIGASSIKLVQLSKRHSKAVLETYGEIALGPYDGREIGQATNLSAEKIAEALRDLMIEAKITSHTAGVAIPFVSSLVTLIELPDVDQKQLEQMVPIEARKYIPVPISEVLIDWSVVPTESRSVAASNVAVPTGQNALKKIEVMVIAIHNQTITKFQEITAKTAIDAAFYEIEMFSSIRAHLEPHDVGSLIIDLGAGSTKLYIVEQGVIQVSHLVSRGGQDITSSLSKSLNLSFVLAEQLKKDTDVAFLAAHKEAASIIVSHLDYIFSEIKTIAASYEKKYNKTIKRTVLIGGGALMKGLVSIAKEKLAIDVILGDPFSHVESPAFLEEILKTKNPEFGVAVGLALRMLQE